MPDDRLLTEQQVAQEFRIDAQWLHNLRKNGGGPTCLKPNRQKVFYKASDIEARIKSWDMVEGLK